MYNVIPPAAAAESVPSKYCAPSVLLFRRCLQTTQLVRLGLMFPIYCLAYMMAPASSYGVFMKNPFIKFVAHSSSYICFLFLLAAASQRIERITLHFIGNQVRLVK